MRDFSTVFRPVSPSPRPSFRAPIWLFLMAAGLWACSDSSGPSSLPSTPTTLIALEGMGAQAPAGTVLSAGPTVELRDQDGNPMADVFVTFQVMAGGGSTPVQIRQTDAQGQARVPWILGREAGLAQRLKASAGSLYVDLRLRPLKPSPGRATRAGIATCSIFPENSHWS